ncbi:MULTISPECIES: hypothetical protein [Haloferax]|uniref:Pentapeptide repeat-containing protein n=1 Tax=Haloferax marinum TaxID=2666143 RepID=A0A6A8G8N5_9EURY|nr:MULTISPECIES: hypothetical protein [Haloferax]KAB1198167.1 hypothetical protein Hfx1150_11815 [Haloferax sp. CBA1150]MRW97247.1 hypothetical protein [Haloferax marinum]
MENVPRCAYEHVCSYDERDGTDAGDHPTVWNCPHPASAEREYCQFHAPIDEKRADETAAALVEVINDPERPSTFVGAQFESLDVAGEILGGDETIDLRDVIVRQDIDLRDATLEPTLRLDAASVGGGLFMHRLDASADVSCPQVQTGGDWVLSEATLDGRLDGVGLNVSSLVARRAHVEGDVSLRKGTVDDQVGLSQANFGGTVRLTHTRVGGRLDLGATVYDGRLSVSHCTVDGDVSLQDATVEDGLVLEHLRVKGEFDARHLDVVGGVDARSSQFDGEVDFTELTTTAGPVDCSYARFDAPVYIDSATVDSTRLSFQNAQFDGGTVSFVRTAISGTVSFSGARFTPSAPFRLVETTVGGSVVCKHTSFGSEVYWTGVQVHGNVDVSDCTITALEFGVEIDGGLDFAYTYVSETAGFTETVVRGAARFTSARFDTEPTLSDATLEGAVATYDLSVEALDST